MAARKDRPDDIVVKGDARHPAQAMNEGPFDADLFGVDANGEPVNAFGRTASQIQRETEGENPADVMAKARAIIAEQGELGDQ